MYLVTAWILCTADLLPSPHRASARVAAWRLSHTIDAGWRRRHDWRPDSAYPRFIQTRSQSTSPRPETLNFETVDGADRNQIDNRSQCTADPLCGRPNHDRCHRGRVKELVPDIAHPLYRICVQLRRHKIGAKVREYARNTSRRGSGRQAFPGPASCRQLRTENRRCAKHDAS